MPGVRGIVFWTGRAGGATISPVRFADLQKSGFASGGPGRPRAGQGRGALRILAAAVLLGAALLPGSCRKKGVRFVTIGTGGVTGIYYPTGIAVSRMINKKFRQYRLKATVESTGGSVFNVNAVLNGDLVFGVVQSDRQFQAYRGLAEWKAAGPQMRLRSVFSIHSEAITLVASQNSGIRTIEDLRSRRVNLGNPGSGQLQNSLDVLTAAGLTEADLNAEHVKPTEAPGLLQDGRIDAFFYTVGHPNANIKEATSGRIKVSIVPVAGPGVEKLLARYPYYAVSTIPHSFYRYALNTADIQSVGVKATFVTSSAVDEDIVYAITREIFDNLDAFKRLHPAYKTLTAADMLSGLSAPIHKGAMRYYREAGLDKYVNPDLIID